MLRALVFAFALASASAIPSWKIWNNELDLTTLLGVGFPSETEGYLAGGAPDVPQGERGRDPKDMTDYFARHGEANMALSAGRFDEGLRMLRELVDEAPENFMIHHQIASGLLAADRNAEAEKELELLVAAAPT